MNKPTNAEVIIQGLENIDDDEVAMLVVHYINCPYTHNPDCKYDGGKTDECCDECKSDWLRKEFND